MTSAARTARKRLGDLLVDAGVITPAQLAAALELQAKLKIPLGRVLVERRAITEQGLVTFLARQLGLEVAVVPDVAPAVMTLVVRDDAERMRVFPLALRKEPKGEVLLLAMADPTNIESIDTLQFKTGLRIAPLIIGESALESAIRRHYYGEARREVAAQGPVQFAGNEVELPSNPGGAAIIMGESSAPVIRGAVVEEDDIPVLTGVQVTPTPLAMRSPFAPGTQSSSSIMFGPSDGFIGGGDDVDAPRLASVASSGLQRGGAASALGVNVGVREPVPELPIVDLGDASVLDPRSDSRIAHVDPAVWPPTAKVERADDPDPDAIDITLEAVGDAWHNELASSAPPASLAALNAPPGNTTSTVNALDVEALDLSELAEEVPPPSVEIALDDLARAPVEEPLALVDEAVLETPAKVKLDASSAMWADAVDHSVIVPRPARADVSSATTNMNMNMNMNMNAPRPPTLGPTVAPLSPPSAAPAPAQGSPPIASEIAGFDADAVDALVRAVREGAPGTAASTDAVPARPQFASLSSSLAFSEMPSPSSPAQEGIPAFVTPGPMPSIAALVAAGRLALAPQSAPGDATQASGPEAAEAGRVAPIPANVASKGPMAKLDDALANAPFCPDCGATRLTEAKFCPHCGCSFTGVQRAKGALPSTPPKTRPMMPAVTPAASAANVVSVALAGLAKIKPGEPLDIEMLEGIKNNVVHLRPRTAPGANVDEPGVLTAKPGTGTNDAAPIGLGVTMGKPPEVSAASDPDEPAVISGTKRTSSPVAAAHLHLVSDVAPHAMASVDDANNLGPKGTPATSPLLAPSRASAPAAASASTKVGDANIAAIEGQWQERLTSQAGLVDDPGALSAARGGQPFALALGVTHKGDVLMDAALVDDPAVLGGNKPAPTHITRASNNVRTSAAFAKVDDAAELGPSKNGSLASDWQDAAEKQIPRKDDRTNLESVPRSREVFFAPDAAAVPLPPAPEPVVAYKPAPPTASAAPAPWARFASPSEPQASAAAGIAAQPAEAAPKKPGAATMMMSLDAAELRALAERLAEKGALSVDEIDAAKKK